MVFAVEAVVEHADLQDLTSASFTVRTKPGNLSRDVHVTMTRPYLERTLAFDPDHTNVVLPVFGLYASYANQVVIRLDFEAGAGVEREFTIQTEASPSLVYPIAPVVEQFDPDLDFGFFLLQGYRPPAIVDVDGELRWMPTGLGGMVFPRVCVPEGMVVGSQMSSSIFIIDWLGHKTEHAMGDGTFTNSHHTIALGKTGLLNTTSRQEGEIEHTLSVLVEMTPTGSVQHAWDFHEIFSRHISSFGEDPSGFVDNGVNWFHMNSAIYCPVDDSILVSSRENFVVKADHATGEIRWLLGNPAKDWSRDYPLSLKPLALTVLGDPPIGQHALSLSADGQYLTLFNNGMGNLTLPDVGDTRSSSTISVYRIDEAAHTAEEVWSFDHDPPIFCGTCSSAYRTAANDILAVYSTPEDEAASRFLVVSQDKRILYEATLDGAGCATAYAMEELRLDRLRLE